jgi:hypothetical protein
MECITFKKGYKYQIFKDYAMDIDIKPDKDIDTEYISLTTDGHLTVKKGYAWDGPSGPTIDTKNFMRGSLVHDALYQLMREKKLNIELHRKPADKLLRRMCKEDGMSVVRAWWVYLGVRIGGESSADPENEVLVYKAPEFCQ